MRRSLLLVIPICAAPLVFGEPPESSMVAEVEKAIVTQTNDFRQQHEQPAVATDDKLMATASKFANFMAETGKYGHNADGNSPAQRAKKEGYEYCVIRENIAYRTNTGDVTAESLIDVFVNGWIDSPHHRENMLAEYVTETGVAVATTDSKTYYAVQLFGRPRSSAIKLKVTNESGDTRTLIVEANDSQDEIDLPPRTVVTMTRCFPTTLRLNDREKDVKLSESADLVITDGGIEKE